MIDNDLALLYGVSTKVLKQQIKRNISRFPPDFMFELNSEEKNELVTKCDRLSNLKHSSVLPMAFTEQGVAMLPSVLRSPTEVQVSIEIVRAFVRLRRLQVTLGELVSQLIRLAEKVPFHDALIGANPQNLVWGTDWPHPRPEGPVPDAARLLKVFLDWTSDSNRQAILVDNPARLYGF